MISDRDYKVLANNAYEVDKEKNDNPIRENRVIEVRDSNEKIVNEYKVLKVHDNEIENGMQAMAVAPIKNGKPDTSQVVIAFAGTNADDGLDILTDTQTVGLNKDTLTTSVEVPSNSSKTETHKKIVDAQSVTALQFADEIRKKYPNASISTTGHSLGEYLALLVAAENKWLNVGFNGPDPYGILSNEAKEWVKNNPGWLTNFRNRGDAIGNLMGNGTGAEIKISLAMGLNPLKGTFHNLSTWKFDDKGRLIIPKNDYNKKAIQQESERQLMQQFVMGMVVLQELKAKFQASGGGLSTNEKIYLEDSQALAVVQLASSEFELAMTNTIKMYQEGMLDLEKLWQKCVSKARNGASDLSHGEIMETLHSVNCTESTMVTLPNEEFREKIAKAKQMSEKFTRLVSEIKSKLAELVQRDQELARQLG